MKNLKLLAMLSALTMVAACETAPIDDTTLNASGNTGANSGMNDGMMTSGSVRPGSQDDLEQNVGDRVFYGYDSSVLTSEGQNTLERQAAWLKQYPSVNVTVEGHADERGTREYNIALGERRANAAKNYLVSLGVDSSRLSVVSYGKERPAVLGSTEDAYAQNRRAVTVVE
ncbi:MAG: peptidoglycan-associated lipoprotein Pal [Alphaproteobacteria bacterium]|nr:peptidoglycan-associated lipoprotein Pal [Alphaproteobacteria bacterium]